MLTHVRLAVCAGVPGTNDAAADTSERRRPAVPIGWGRIPGHETAFCDRLPFLLTTEVRSCTMSLSLSYVLLESSSAVCSHSLGHGAWTRCGLLQQSAVPPDH